VYVKAGRDEVFEEAIALVRQKQRIHGHRH